MSEQLPQLSDLEIAMSSVKNLLEQWRATWISPDKGPFFMHDFARQHISDEQQTAQEPEDEAYRMFVEGTATEIARFAKLGKHGEMLKKFYLLLEEQTRISSSNKQRVLTDVAKRSLDLVVDLQR